jgi:hypothetical protein
MQFGFLDHLGSDKLSFPELQIVPYGMVYTQAHSTDDADCHSIGIGSLLGTHITFQGLTSYQDILCSIYFFLHLHILMIQAKMQDNPEIMPMDISKIIYMQNPC